MAAYGEIPMAAVMIRDIVAVGVFREAL